MGSQIPLKGERPTPEDVIPFIALMANAEKQKNFSGIRYAIEHLDLFDYWIYFTFHFEELYNKSAEEEDKKNMIHITQMTIIFMPR